MLTRTTIADHPGTGLSRCQEERRTSGQLLTYVQVRIVNGPQSHWNWIGSSRMSSLRSNFPHCPRWCRIQIKSRIQRRVCHFVSKSSRYSCVSIHVQRSNTGYRTHVLLSATVFDTGAVAICADGDLDLLGVSIVKAAGYRSKQG